LNLKKRKIYDEINNEVGIFFFFSCVQK